MNKNKELQKHHLASRQQHDGYKNRGSPGCKQTLKIFRAIPDQFLKLNHFKFISTSEHLAYLSRHGGWEGLERFFMGPTSGLFLRVFSFHVCVESCLCLSTIIFNY